MGTTKISVVNPLGIDDGLSSLGMVGRQNTSAIIWFTDMINLSNGLILELASYYVRSSQRWGRYFKKVTSY